MSRESSQEPSPAAKSALGGSAFVLLAVGAGLIVVLAAVLLFRNEDPRVPDPTDPDAALTAGGTGAAWTPPPADAAMNQLVPQAFGGWTLDTNDDTARNPAFGLTRDGVHGRYTKAGAAQSADLYVYPAADDPGAADAELAAVRERLSDEARFGAVRFAAPQVAPGAKTLRFDIASRDAADGSAAVPEMHGVLASAGGWLLFARSESGAADLPAFLAAYMRSAEADGAAEAPPAAAPGDRTAPVAPNGGRLGN